MKTRHLGISYSDVFYGASFTRRAQSISTLD
jgi:hypothetical protein